MNESARIAELAQRLASMLPDGFSEARSDLEKNFKAVLGSWLEKLDLVTREEFDVQAAVLARTRARLEALEKRLDEELDQPS